MEPKDIYALTAAGDPRVSPDGSTIAYTVTTYDEEQNDARCAIWLVAADGSAPPKRFTAGDKKDMTPRWSPDGRFLAFTSTRDRKEPQLYVIPVDGGDAVKLTDRNEAVTDPVWSPDGATILFNSRVRHEDYDEEDDRKRKPRRLTRLQFKLDSEGWTYDRPKHLFTVPSDGSAEPSQVTRGESEDSGGRWSPDGEQIVFVSARHEDWDTTLENDLYVVPAAGGEPERLTWTDGPLGAPSWSPDGSQIAYLFAPGVFDFPRHSRIAVYDVATKERRMLTDALDLNCSPYPPLREPAWDSDSIVFGVEDGGNTHLYRVRADGTKDAEPIVTGERGITGFDIAAGTLAFSASDPTTEAQIFVGDARLTGHGGAIAATGYERFTGISKDGSEVDAWIVRPKDFDPAKKYPTILSIHGGPFTQYGNRLFDEFQVYTGAGYIVLFANPRGSSGYSEAWGRGIHGTEGSNWGGVDYEDLMGVVDTAIETFPEVDADRLGVIGGSYGGYMTSWIIGHTNRFRSAVSERAVNDWTSMWGASDFGWVFGAELGAPLYDDPEMWQRISPVTYVKDINTPVLILHSENDFRCPIEQAEQLFTSLRLLKKPVEFVRFPVESHELSRAGSPAHRVMRFDVILEWFGRTL